MSVRQALSCLTTHRRHAGAAATLLQALRELARHVTADHDAQDECSAAVMELLLLEPEQVTSADEAGCRAFLRSMLRTAWLRRLRRSFDEVPVEVDDAPRAPPQLVQHLTPEDAYAQAEETHQLRLALDASTRAVVSRHRDPEKAQRLVSDFERVAQGEVDRRDLLTSAQLAEPALYDRAMGSLYQDHSRIKRRLKAELEKRLGERTVRQASASGSTADTTQEMP
jgi:hypothetical protein